MQASKIKPFLWYDGQAEEAARFYTSIFPNPGIGAIGRYPDGRVMTVGFRLNEDQKEVDYYGDKLVAGGQPSQCGWLKDRYGLSWQVVPKALGRLFATQDAKKAERVMNAMLKMVKLDVETLEGAAR